MMLLQIFSVAFLAAVTSAELLSPWHFTCKDGFCQKELIKPDDDESKLLSLAACSYVCNANTILWPKPTGDIELSKDLVKVNINSIDVIPTMSDSAYNSKSTHMISGAIKNFKAKISALAPKRAKINSDKARSVEIKLNVKDAKSTAMPLDLDESYEINVVESTDGRLLINITASNNFGGRHGLETLNQLVLFDNLRNEYLMPTLISIKDKPAYPYRGILLDTSRNYMSVESIKRTLKGMGASKLNSLHWHITDSHSFPYVSKSLPELSKLGAYTAEKIYSPEDVAEIVQLGLEQGVRVIPEFDAPAHVGEGWQNTGFVVCFNKKPWQDFCVEPPCGQFDPTQDGLYDTLEKLYGDMLEQFEPSIFHMGGDEVHFNCWNTTDSITQWMQTQGWNRTEADFIKLWNTFQERALERFEKKAAGQNIPVVMWTSTLTQKEYLHNLPNDKYIIQIWTDGKDAQIKNLIDNKYRVILSNYDALYLDCGFSGWVQGGLNWCSPYKGWQVIYDNSPAKIVSADKSLVLGSEATLWTEQVDSSAVDSRLWPRAASMAEVLWSEPQNSWRDAEQRFLIHRERLVQLGINADALEPEWCLQNEENCPINAKKPLGLNKGMLASLSSFNFLAVGILILIFK